MNDVAWRMVVPTERHVERLASEAPLVETLATLKARLFAELMPDVTFAGPAVTRLALVRILPQLAATATFLAPALGEGPHAFQRTVDAVDEAIAIVRRTGCHESLARVGRGDGHVAERARAIAGAIDGVDRVLGGLGTPDDRAANARLARALREMPAERVVTAVGAHRVVARFIVAWHPTELAWWRALDEALSRRGGRATIELPVFDVTIDTARASTVLDHVSEEIAAGLDDAPGIMTIEARLGDLRCADPPSSEVRARVTLRRSADTEGQAAAVAEVVHRALTGGVPPERIAVLMPRPDRETIGPIERALDDVGVVTHAPRIQTPSALGVSAYAMEALVVAERGLMRTEVAAVLRSHYADPSALTGIEHEAQALRALRRLSSALERTATAHAEDPIRALEATVRAWQRTERRPREEDALLPALAVRVGTLLTEGVSGRSRLEHAARARVLWTTLRLSERALSGQRALFATDAAAAGAGRAELRAIARDAQSWESLTSTLDAYEVAVARVGLGTASATNETFRDELASLLEQAAQRPASGRAGVVRLVRAAEILGEPLDLLVIVNANEGTLPRTDTLPLLVSRPLEARLREVDARFPNAASRANSEMAELAMAVSMAERIVLTYRARDDSGAILAPAAVVAWLDRGGVQVDAVRGGCLRAPPLTLAEARLRELALMPERAASIHPSAAARARRERIREAFFAGEPVSGPEVGALPPGELLQRVLEEETGGATRPMAVTSLERFAVCPFQGYAAHILGAREKRTSEETPDARDQGSMVHGALAAAFRETASLWTERPRDSEAIRTRALAAADAFLEREAVASGLRRLAIDQARRDVQRVIDWSIDDLAWDFVAAEQPFGDGEPSSWRPASLEDGTARLALRGSIDRVDLAHGPAAVRVIDYKLGAATALRATKGLGELSFQLPVYARASADNYSATRAAGLYLPAHARDLAPGYAPRGYADAWTRATEEEDGRPRFERRALAVVVEVRAGGLLPVPSEARACEYCAFDGGCRKPRFAIAAAAPEERERNG